MILSDLGILERRVKHRCQMPPPILLLFGCRDQVVAQFDQYMRQAGLHAVPVERITGKMPAIGLIIADTDITRRPKLGQKWQGQARIARIEHAHMPRARRAPLELRGKGMDRQDHRVRAAGKKPRQCIVVGAVKQGEPLFDLGGVCMAIGGDDRSVIDFHAQRWVILAPVRLRPESG